MTVPDALPAGPMFRGRRYAAFLFDMDGTLLDSSAVVTRVWGAWADRHGVDRAALLATIHGVRAADTIARWAPDADLAAETAWVEAAEIADLDGIVALAGARAMLAALAPSHWALVTSAPRALARVRLAAAGLPSPATFVGAEDVARGKPDPEGFLIAAARLGVAIGDCLVFEDSAAGIAAGLAAGASVVAIGTAGPAGVLATLPDYSAV